MIKRLGRTFDIIATESLTGGRKAVREETHRVPSGARFPALSSPGDHAAMEASPGAMARMPPPSQLLREKLTR